MRESNNGDSTELRVITHGIARAAAGIIMVNNMNSDEAIAQTGSARAEVTAPNKNSSNHSSDANLQPTNRDLALTRKRTGHIDAAVRLLGHFVAAALVVLWSVFQLVMGKVNAIGNRSENEFKIYEHSNQTLDCGNGGGDGLCQFHRTRGKPPILIEDDQFQCRYRNEDDSSQKKILLSLRVPNGAKDVTPLGDPAKVGGSSGNVGTPVSKYEVSKNEEEIICLI